MRIFLISITLFISCLCFAKDDAFKTKTEYQQDVLGLKKRVETIESKLLENPDVSKVYLEILEKTNNQLSVWNNPYGISVGILSALLAVLAIGVAFVLYKQSADHKHQTKEEETQRKKSFEIFLYSSASSLKAINLHIEESKADYDKLIAEQKNKLDNADSKDIEEIRKQLDELKKEKAKVSGDMSQTVIAQWPNLRSLAMLGGGPSAHKCSSCNYGFKVKNLNKGFILSPSDKAEVTCPKCKNIDLV